MLLFLSWIEKDEDTQKLQLTQDETEERKPLDWRDRALLGFATRVVPSPNRAGERPSDGRTDGPSVRSSAGPLLVDMA